MQDVASGRSAIFIVLVCAALGAPEPALGDDFTHDYVGLSFTGNGKAPSALDLFEAQARAPKAVDASVDASVKGDAGFTYAVPLPPAHLAPSLTLSYSSAAGAHSVVGRGWSLSSGLTVSRPTGRAARAYEVAGTHLVQGGGLDGLLVPEGGGWRYVSSTPAAVKAEYDPQTLTWTVDHGGTVTELAPRDDVDWSSGPTPTRWDPIHAEDRHGNEVEWTWIDGVLTSVAFGGRPARGEPHFLEVSLTYGSFPDYPRSYQEDGGRIDVVEHRLEAVSVLTDGLLQHELVLDYDWVNGEPSLSSLDQYGSGVWKNLYRFEYTQPDSTHTTVTSDLPAFMPSSLTAPAATNHHNDNVTVRELKDVSGDGLLDLLDCDGTSCAPGWFTWAGAPSWKRGAWEDPATSGRSYSRPYADQGLERTENVPIAMYHGHGGAGGGSGQEDFGYEYGSYTLRAVVDLDGDGHADLLTVASPDLQAYDEGPGGDTEPWVTNLTPGSYTWHAYMGGPGGFSSVPIVLQAPFRAIRISRAPWIDGGPKYPTLMSFHTEGPVVDLMDMNGDGWLDVVSVDPGGEPARLAVWHFDPDGDWLSRPPAYPAPADMDGRLQSIATNKAYLEVDPRTESVVDYKHDPTHIIDRMEGVRGFMDLNGDGFVDFVDTEYWNGNGGYWEVWLGTADGFDDKRLWRSPLRMFSASVEGFPEVESCGFVLDDHGEGWNQLMPATITSDGGGMFDVNVSGGCSTTHGSPQDVRLMLMDVDGDGRADLVLADDPLAPPARRWWRNTGSGFSMEVDTFGRTGRTDLLSTLPLRTLSRHRTSQLLIYNSNWSHAASAGQQSAANYGLRTQHLWVGDLNGDGLLDSIVMGDLETNDAVRYSSGTRPGLLSRIVRGEGAETSLEYLTSATMWPSGTGAVSEHLMGSHRELVVTVDLFDPVTGYGYARHFMYEDGYCEDGACWGFAWRQVEHERHDPYYHVVGQRDLVLRTTSEYELSRDDVLPVHEVHEVDWSDAWRRPGISTPHLAPRFETHYTYGDFGASAPYSRWLTSRTNTEHPDPVEGTTGPRSSSASLVYDAVGNVIEVHHEAGANHPDNISIYVDYVSDAAGTLYLPKDHRTTAWSHQDGAFRVVQEGRFAYDDGAYGAAPTVGDLTHQVVCAGFNTAPCHSTLEWHFTWSSRGLLAEALGPAGFAKHQDNPVYGGLLPSSERNALHHVTQHSYDELGRAIETVDPNGVIQFAEYDAFGRVLEEARQGAKGQVIKVASYAYHDDTIPRHVTITRYSYDDAGVESSYTEHEVLDGLGRVVQRWRADELGHGWFVTEEVADLASGSTYTSYPHHELAFSPVFQQTKGHRVASRSLVGPFGSTWEAWEDASQGSGRVAFSYPDPGVVRAVDAEGRVHEAHHDVYGRLVEVREGAGPSASLTRTASYLYDGRDRIVRFTDGNNNHYHYLFDTAGRQRTVYRSVGTGPLVREYNFTYNGPYPTRMHANGILSAEWTYDVLGRTVDKRVLHPDGGWDRYAWRWDAAWIGARSSTADPRGTVLYTYGAYPVFGSYGWPTEVSRTWDDLSGSIAIRRTYDYAGNEVETRWPSKRTVWADYSETGWLLEHRVADHWTRTPHTSILYSYDEFGLPAGFVAEQGGPAPRVYKASTIRDTPTRPDRLRWMFNDELLHEVRWDYYLSGLLHTKMVYPPMDDPFVYEYDDFGRIESVSTRNTLLEGFAYDAIGNPATGGYRYFDGTISYGTPPRFNEVPSRSTDAGDVEHYTWNAESRLASRVVIPATGGTAARHTFKYRYDGAGRLMDVERAERYHSTWTVLDYDVDDQVVREHRTNASNQVQEIYRFDGWRYEAVSGEVIEQVLPVLKMVGTGTSRERRWTQLEPDGHALATYDSDGNGLTFEIAGAYGQVLPDPWRLLGSDVFASQDHWPIEGLHGLENDRNLGLVHAGTRHFMMRDGLWLQPEPLLHMGLHAGDHNQPLGFTGTYAVGNTNAYEDRSGRNPVALGMFAALAYYLTAPNVANAPSSTSTTIPDQSAQILIDSAGVGVSVADGAATAGAAKAVVQGAAKRMGGKGAALKGPALPDSAWQKNAPKQVEPGTKSIVHKKGNETSLVEYDDYGRQKARTDYSDHGRPKDHTDPHHHTTEYGPGKKDGQTSGPQEGPAPGHPEEPP